MRPFGLAIGLVWIFAGCSSSGGQATGGSGHLGAGGSSGAGGGGSGGSGGVGTGGSGGIDPTMDALNCGVQTFMLQRDPAPDVLIVLDRSSSMSFPPAEGGGSKWSQATMALNFILAQPGLQTGIRWGLEFFPSNGNCFVTSVAVPVSANGWLSIPSAIAQESPQGDTPTADAVHRAQLSLTGLGDPSPKYILLATDGDPNCPRTYCGSTCTCVCTPGSMQVGDQCCVGSFCFPCPGQGTNGVEDARTAVTEAAAAAIHTFVIGLATDQSSAMVLDDLAMRGLEPRSGGPPFYYRVQNQQELVSAITSIAGQIISCNLALQMPPPNPGLVHVIINGNTMVPRDTTHTNGWDFGPGNMSIQLYGSYCVQLQNGQITSVQAIFECPPVGIHN